MNLSLSLSLSLTLNLTLTLTLTRSLNKLRGYKANNERCRWQFLRQAFDEDQLQPCGQVRVS